MAAGSTDRRIDKLIELLVKNATVVVPGPKIASEIGVTRLQVWRWIENLRLLGVEIRGVPAEGYQLVTIPDILAPSLVRAELGDNPIGRNIVHYFRTDSTNAVALKLAAEWRRARHHGAWRRSKLPAGAAWAARGFRKNPAAFTPRSSFGRPSRPQPLPC